MESFDREPLADEPAAENKKRGRPRDSLFLTAKLTFVGSEDTREVRVRNLSEGGMMAELDRVVDAGTAVMLDLRGIGEVVGKVAWCTEGRIGIAFDRKIDPRLARKPVGQGARTPVYATPVGFVPPGRPGF
ncbi:MAG TPA: PilZ domain-containing protein [Sphingomonas sp.]|jgi:hypothetical protein|nr:PilZ domain-containing protein [Sphingomonas sp.]